MNNEIIQYLSKITKEEKDILDGNGIQRSIYMEEGSTEIDAKRLLAKGKLIDIRAHTRFIHFPKHTHNYIEMVYMCKGNTTHFINGTKIQLHEGELLIMGNGTTQEILPAKENDIAVNFIVLPQFFDRTLEMLNNEESPLRAFIIASLGNQKNSDYLYFKVKDILPVQNLIENLLWTFIKDIPNSRSIRSVTMGLLFLELLNNTDQLVHESGNKEITIQVLRYIEDNYKDASLNTIASILHYDLAWLSREIKRKTGKTFKELLQEKRLSQAIYLLSNTSMRVDEIAEAVGYQNISYFHRIFFQKYACTPKQYRKKDCTRQSL